MAGRAQRLKLRLFLEGVEVPVIGAQVVGLPNAPLMASIQIPPLAEGTRFHPRTLVHLFFNDFYETDSPYLKFNKSVEDASAKDPSAYEQSRRGQQAEQTGEEQDAFASDVENESYKLLFVGEMLGFQWTKNQANRSLVLQCQDLSNYWDYAYQWSNTGLFGPGIKALFSGGSTNLFTDFLSTQGEELVKSLRHKSLTFPNLKGLAGGLIHMLEQIGGSYQTAEKIAGTNIFFTLAELRLHIMQQIVAYENDPTAENLLARQGYGGLFNRLLGGQGKQTSIRQSLNALQAVIFHETYAQPCPAYEPGAGGTVSGKVQRKLGDDPRTAGVAVAIAALRESIVDVKRQLEVADQAPDVSRPAFEDRKVLGALRQIIVTKLGEMRATLQRINATGFRNVDAAGADGLVKAASQAVGYARALTSSRWQPTDQKSVALIERELDLADEKLRRLQQITVNQTSKKDVRPARLNQQIFRPDVWFSAPPRCNVLFPDQYDTLTYSRNFMEEPTRLLLKTNDEFFGEDELFDHFYFAPKTRSVKKDKVKLQNLLQNDLLEHEILTGILPVFEKMGELNIFAARGGVVKDKAQNVGLAQRSANFLYFKYRFAARQMQVRGRFNPYVVMGFPGVVIDRYVDIDTLKLYNELLEKAGRPTRDINKLLGTNFLGNFTQVTHTVNQQQGASEFVLSYPRQPEESVEFLGATDKETVQVEQRFAEPAVRTTDVAALTSPRVMSLGPNKGRIVRVQEVTDLYQDPLGETTLPSKPLLLFRGTNASDKFFGDDGLFGPVTAAVPIGVDADANKLAKNVLAALGIELPKLDIPTLLPNAKGRGRHLVRSPFPVVIRAWRIDEEIPRFHQETVDLPAEEYIRPGWYGDIWHPANIGKAYQTFFKTGSITDATTVEDTSSSAPVTAVPAGDPGDPTTESPPNFQLLPGASIEQAVAFIVSTYSYIRHQGLDVEEYLRAFTYRPIASMVDCFGTSDLQLSQDGSEVIQGIEGLFSRSFGPYDNLFALVTPAIEEVVGLKRDTLAAQKGDTRLKKRNAVLDYLSAISYRAILG